MYKRVLALLSCLSLLLFAGGCGKKATEKPHIAVIVKAVDSDFWQNVQHGVEAAATEYNVSVTFEGPENEEDYITQNAMINRAVADGAQAIVLSAIDYTRCVDAVEDAVRRGVKVVTIDSDVGSDMVSRFIGTDNRAAGEAAARAAISLFSDTTPVCIGIVNYMADTDNGQKREEGFREYVDSVPRARVVAAVTAENHTDNATIAALSLLEKYPQINVLVGFNEWMTLGVGNAIEKRDAADTVCGIGFDTNVQSVELLETGEMDALIVQNPFAIGYLGVQNAACLLRGETLAEKVQNTDVTTVTRDNMFDDNIQRILFRFDN